MARSMYCPRPVCSRATTAARMAKAAIRPPPAKSARRLSGIAGRPEPLGAGRVAAGGGERAAGRDVVDVVAHVGGVGAGLPVAAQRAVDQARVAGGQRVVVDAQALDDAGPESLQHDVGLVRQAMEDPAGGVGLEVEGQRSLVAPQGRVRGGPAQRGLVARRGRRLRPDVARVVDDEDVGPHVAQQHGAVGAGREPGQVEDAEFATAPAAGRLRCRGGSRPSSPASGLTVPPMLRCPRRGVKRRPAGRRIAGPQWPCLRWPRCLGL